MPFYDLPEDELKTYKPEREEPKDFDTFWEDTLKEARDKKSDPVFEKVDYGLKLMETYDVTFSGYDGQPIKGWPNIPSGRTGPLPCIVEYIGYGGGRSFPLNWLIWASAGYAHFIMDTRGQGSVWQQGDTLDIEPHGSSPQYPGYMTNGIYSPETYY